MGFLATLVLLAPASPAHADIGPENTVVVVNAMDVDSMTVANHYVEFRQIPSLNVIELAAVPTGNRISLEQFKTLILQPLLDEIGRRQLGNQVRAIAYSVGFPLEIDISPHTKRIADDKLRRLMTPVASITGLTFHFIHVTADSEAYLSLTPNLYARMPIERFFANPFGGEDAARIAEAAKLAADGEDADAAEAFAKLFDSHPNHHPLAVLAAKHFAAADLMDEADRYLELAIAAGWTSGEYLRVDPSLGKIVDRPRWLSRLDAMDSLPIDFQPAIGFRGDRVWAPSGVAVPPGSHGLNYLLACCLGVRGPSDTIKQGGMSVEEIVEHLRRSAAADTTLGDHAVAGGRFLFTETGDVRTKARLDGFAPAIKTLGTLGYRAQTVPVSVPAGNRPILGLMMGTPGFDWPAFDLPGSRSTADYEGNADLRDKKDTSALVDGSLADNLTSYGGIFGRPGQTKLTKLLRGGAAMSSGTVTEPYAVQMKFPHPMMHVHYVRGLTAIEAFYSSIQVPYQTLIVGEPMCRAFAPRPRYDARWIQTPGNPASLSVTAESKSAEAVKIAEVEIYLDGHWSGASVSEPMDAPEDGAVANVGIGQLATGYHQIAAALVSDDPIEHRQTVREWVAIRRNPGIPVAEGERSGDSGATVRLRSDAGDAIELRYHGRVVGRVEGTEGSVGLDPIRCGTGPVRVQPFTLIGDQAISGKPIVVDVPTPQPSAATR